MRSSLVIVGAVAIAGAVYFSPRIRAATGPIPLNCDRACLEGVVDQYIAALSAHDPKRLPLSEDVTYTENDQKIDVGDGFWKTVEGPGEL